MLVVLALRYRATKSAIGRIANVSALGIANARLKSMVDD